MKLNAKIEVMAKRWSKVLPGIFLREIGNQTMKSRFLRPNLVVIIFLLYIPQAESRWYDQDTADLGAKIFQQNCAACHGANAQGLAGQQSSNNDGSLAPALNGTAHAWHHPKDVLKQIIKHGGSKVGGSIASGSMPSFVDKLSDREIDSVIAYIQSEWPEDIYQKWASIEPGNSNQPGDARQNNAGIIIPGTNNMTALLKKRLGTDEVSDPVVTPVDDLYQTQFGKDYAYLTGDGRYLFMGDLIDLQQEQNLTNNAKRNLETPLAKTLMPETTGVLKNRNITDLLKLRLGSDDISDPVKTPVDRIYAARFGANYAYLTEDGRYVIVGSMVDLLQGLNLTTIARKRTAVALLSQFDTRDKAIFPAVGEEKAVINIFTDTTCPYCKKLHEELPKLQEAGISVHYLPYPRGGQDGPGYQSLKQVWCAQDRANALSIGKGLKSGSLPVGDCQSGDLVDKGYALGNQLGMAGTPAIFKSNGESIQGYVPYQKLIPKVLKN